MPQDRTKPTNSVVLRIDLEAAVESGAGKSQSVLKPIDSGQIEVVLRLARASLNGHLADLEARLVPILEGGKAKAEVGVVEARQIRPWALRGCNGTQSVEAPSPVALATVRDPGPGFFGGGISARGGMGRKLLIAH